ncbi:MAG TPA: hypothetical protein VF373_13860 [Prolixibacteraceae bacterium]
MRILFIIGSLIASILFSSCGGNRLKTDEKALSKQILTEEQQLAKEDAMRTEREKQLVDSIAKLPKGFRFKEQRGIDAQKPPVVIDIAGSLNNIANKQLSDVASEVKYIRIEVPDPKLLHDLKFKYYLMDNYIVAINLYGTHLFSREGKFIRTVVKNQLTGVDFDKKNNWLTYYWKDYTMVGGGTSVWVRGKSLFYLYSNNISGQRYIMEYDCTQDQLAPDVGFDPENQNKIIGLGKVLIDMNHGNTTPPKPRKHQGMRIVSPENLYQWVDVF